ncbi:hypothetical protein D9Q98_010434 [Chlorella vulgaris]|uniref:Reverse transcriptase domain-containing protein n=1 Tax=Chlorella vulgaris TaxID=3077 RepID=A0A9D4YYI5_CHLVU|nr:hypothetical protein D9Q98_010434 [Chlorella vulgaris]
MLDRLARLEAADFSMLFFQQWRHAVVQHKELERQEEEGSVAAEPGAAWPGQAAAANNAGKSTCSGILSADPTAPQARKNQPWTTQQLQMLPTGARSVVAQALLKSLIGNLWVCQLVAVRSPSSSGSYFGNVAELNCASLLRTDKGLDARGKLKIAEEKLEPFEPTTAPPAINPATCHSTPLSTASSELDSDISVADVHAALDKLSSSSACLGPLKAVLIKAGRDALTPVLAALFNAVFRSGCFPPEWSLGAITPIHKKGDTADPNNYRGITVGHILGKLYALAINTRLNTWLETQGLRARGQAGFRQGYRTVDNCFILRALAERARSRGVKLYLCAVDFEKAFDSVDRPLLWAALQRAGIGGTMLQAIQAMYADVPVCVRTEEGLSGCFQSVLGVKQGCPLSPLLFGIFLDDFEGHIQQLGDAAALPQLAGRTVPPLLFADDMFLLSSSASGLQAQLHALQDYCNAKKLTVNAKKTQVMIMRPGGGSGNGKLAAGESFEYAGLPLEVASSTKYLGLTFSQLSKQHGFASCADVLAKAGRQAMFAMRRRAWELGACLVEQQCMLFDVFVKPVLSYGCELWGVDVLLRPDCSSVERVHRWFCRRVQGLPKQVTAAISLAELGRQPLQSFWIQQLVRFWNRLQNSAADEDRVLGWAFKDNLELMREGGDLAAGSACWSRRWLHVLQSAPPASGTLEWLTELDEAAVIERAAAAYLRKSFGNMTYLSNLPLSLDLSLLPNFLELQLTQSRKVPVHLVPMLGHPTCTPRLYDTTTFVSSPHVSARLTSTRLDSPGAPTPGRRQQYSVRRPLRCWG